jgi:CRP-like cAMP-binding protein
VYLPGESFGDLAIVNHIPRTATVRTVGNCELLVLDPEVFTELFETDLARVAGQAAIALKQCVRAFETLPMRYCPELSRSQCDLMQRSVVRGEL